MSFRTTLKNWIPPRFHPPLRACLSATRTLIGYPSAYDGRLQKELDDFKDGGDFGLPPITYYWSTKFLVPMIQPLGFSNSIEMLRLYMSKLCHERPEERCIFLSLGCGNAPTEICVAQWLTEQGVSNFAFECVDVNPEMLRRARLAAESKGLGTHFIFTEADLNSWRAKRKYDAILAVQYLHHVVHLEKLLDRIHEALHDGGYFMTDDMIGRNGHQRWPEALRFVNELWRELPDKYKWNHRLKRFEKEYDNWDCSTESFEGIRCQDILPLLMERFHFELFIGFGNIVDIFIDRCFGPNFDPENEWDRAFIDRVHALDVQEIESGRVKPTHIYAVMTKEPVTRTMMHQHLSPEFCVRRP